MKKKILFSSAIAIFALGVIATVSASRTATNDLLFANVEALANNEGGGSSTSWTCWSASSGGSGTYTACGNPCTTASGKPKGPSGTCVAN